MFGSKTVVRERRRAPRVLREWSVEIKNAAGVWRGTSVDVSTGGMRVRLDRPLIPRRLMFISFEPGDSLAGFWTPFSLVRENPPAGEYAIHFVDLPQQQAGKLGRLLLAPVFSAAFQES